MKHTLTRSSVDTLLNGLDGLNGISRGDGEQRHCLIKKLRRSCASSGDEGKAKGGENDSPYIP